MSHGDPLTTIYPAEEDFYAFIALIFIAGNILAVSCIEIGEAVHNLWRWSNFDVNVKKSLWYNSCTKINIWWYNSTHAVTE